MKDNLVRFGVAMEESLLHGLDRLVAARGTTRSEALRDLVRAEISRSIVRSRGQAVAALTIVYNHHVRDLADRHTEMQHQLGGSVRSTMHVHLDAELCLEVIVLTGRADQIGEAAERILGVRGVTHGGVEIVALGTDAHAHERAHALGHPHAHPPHADAVATSARKKAKARARKR